MKRGLWKNTVEEEGMRGYERERGSELQKRREVRLRERGKRGTLEDEKVETKRRRWMKERKR